MKPESWVLVPAVAALVLAVVALALGAASRRSARRTGAPTRAQAFPYWIAPLAIIIGVLPGILRLSEAVRLAGSVTSLIISLTAIVLLAARARKS